MDILYKAWILYMYIYLHNIILRCWVVFIGVGASLVKDLHLHIKWLYEHMHRARGQSMHGSWLENILQTSPGHISFKHVD